MELPGFGLIEPERVLAQDDLFVVVLDKYPVATGHTLIVPRRPVGRFMELSNEERARLMSWVSWAQQRLQGQLRPAPEGFNLAVNDGAAAGQTVSQFHFHVIPRRVGDVADPRGGVRWVIPEKARYWQARSGHGGRGAEVPAELQFGGRRNQPSLIWRLPSRWVIRKVPKLPVSQRAVAAALIRAGKRVQSLLSQSASNSNGWEFSILTWMHPP